MNVTVFGATGGIGREVVTQALDAGHHVTAYLRNPTKLTVTHPNLTVITGELTDRDTVQRAVHGADAVMPGDTQTLPPGTRSADYRNARGAAPVRWPFRAGATR
jgi:uncharacterized protein YbjT (DUF2867 family)